MARMGSACVLFRECAMSRFSKWFGAMVLGAAVLAWGGWGMAAGSVELRDREQPAEEPPNKEQPGKNPAPKAPADKGADGAVIQEIAKQLEELAKPGPEHRILDGLIGEWTTEGELLIPGAPAIKIKGTTTNRWVLGGRFVQSETTGDPGVISVSAINIFGFETGRHRKYTMFGIDTMGTYSITCAGDYDAQKQTIRFEGADEFEGQKINFRIDLKLSGETYEQDTSFEMSGKWEKVAGLKATKKKG